MSEGITYKSNSINDIELIVSKIKAEMENSLVLFIGDLGAGKTTMIKEMLRQMGCVDQGSSPSYSIINEYESAQGPIYHVDLYRMNSAEETFALGIEEIIYSGRPCFIEWPEVIIDYIDDGYHILKINIIENNFREIHFS